VFPIASRVSDMQPPFSVGAILQNRYRVLNVLGQGGFGRTYLAEDQGRFNELCALKELIPAQTSAYALEKSKELFQREAAILYQIQHPQIPQFRATFEQDQRFFLVQDYVEGRTYQLLLDERKAQGYAFSEPEVLQFMRQLLPVLAHIHSKGIIHRDIAPDNVILRERDRLPVLIDFGVVKEVATRIQFDSLAQPTTVGKQGYAPPEQIQAGRAYPNSDLYSLAVTAIVLLTGREPNELYDDNTMSWHWQHYASVSPNFGHVLSRMLNHRPGDRYQSVSEVVQALQGTPVAPAAPPPTMPPTPAAPDLSRVPTMAVGRRPDPMGYSTNTPNRADPVIPTPTATRSSLWDDPWAVGAIGLGLVLLTGVGSWVIVSLVRNNQQVQVTPSATVTTVTPSPTVSNSPSPSPSPTTNNTEPVVVTRRLDIGSNTTITIPGSLRANETVNYVLSAQGGQQLSTALTGEGVLLTVLAPDNEPIDNSARRRQQWQGKLPFDGSYTIQLSPVKGAADRNYKLEVTLTTPSPSPSPTTPPTSVDQQTVPPGEFEQGTVTRTGNVTPNVIRRYLVNLQQGQTLRAEVFSDGGANLTFRFPEAAGGQPIPDMSGTAGEIQAPYNGLYQIDVSSSREVGYTLELNLINPQ
jgi:serine/threonine protein kinase